MNWLKEWKNIRIDKNAYNLLQTAKTEMEEKGIYSPTLSDAVRWINERDSRENSVNE